MIDKATLRAVKRNITVEKANGTWWVHYPSDPKRYWKSTYRLKQFTGYYNSYNAARTFAKEKALEIAESHGETQ
tara:strand:+ start:378 stop:599 length:222 start_codon:yes stop_codon:yes gene_type:complete